MLCTNCSGTEYSLLPSTGSKLLVDDRRAAPGAKWTICRACLGQGSLLVRDGSCTGCGATLLHCQACRQCGGLGKVMGIPETVPPLQARRTTSDRKYSSHRPAAD